MWKKQIKLKNVLNSIFPKIPLSEFSENQNLLDVYYFKNHSGNKTISPLVESMVENIRMDYVDLSDDHIEVFGTISDANQTLLGQIIKMQFGDKWMKLFATLNLDYNPIENYNMTESSTDNDHHTGTVGTDREYQYGQTISNTMQTTSNADGEMYGFNSNIAVPSDTQSATSEQTNDQTYGGSNSENETVTNNTQYAREHSLTRAGNIGVTTTQQMIQAERDLQMWNIYDTIFNDIDKILTISVY